MLSLEDVSTDLAYLSAVTPMVALLLCDAIYDEMYFARYSEDVWNVC